MQAEDRAEREESAEDGENAAPPAGAEAGCFGIAEEIVDFLFERGVTQVCSSSFVFGLTAKLRSWADVPQRGTREDRAIIKSAGNGEQSRHRRSLLRSNRPAGRTDSLYDRTDRASGFGTISMRLELSCRSRGLCTNCRVLAA